METINLEGLRKCPVCDKEAKSEIGLLQRWETKHPGQFREESSKGSSESRGYYPLDPYLYLLFVGIRKEKESPLRALKSYQTSLLPCIWAYVYPWLRDLYENSFEPDDVLGIAMRSSFKVGSVKFPRATGLCINMLPFVVGDKNSLPKNVRQYWPMILQCKLSGDHGKVAYLTIDESMVTAGESQRRPGLHTEAPGRLKPGGKMIESQRWSDEEPHPGWGRGGYRTERDFYGGIYLASSVARSCRLYKGRVVTADVIGDHGSVEHLRKPLQDWGVQGEFMGRNELWWMTDRVPHESVKLLENRYRQFFRVVSPEISVWYADHSTANPSVKIPKSVRVLKGDKFTQN